MILTLPSYEIVYSTNYPLERIEAAGRICYKSEDRITKDSAERFVERIIKSGHHSVLEHGFMSVKFICDRGVSHELVRHRLCSFSQESTRYCDYKGGVEFIIPPWVEIEPGIHDFDSIDHLTGAAAYWAEMMVNIEYSYQRIRNLNWSPQQARSVLPNSLKTEIVMTANFREWRHIFTLRTSSKSHPQMTELMRPLLVEVKRRIPIIFEDIYRREEE